MVFSGTWQARGSPRGFACPCPLTNKVSVVVFTSVPASTRPGSRDCEQNQWSCNSQYPNQVAQPSQSPRARARKYPTGPASQLRDQRSLRNYSVVVCVFRKQHPASRTRERPAHGMSNLRFPSRPCRMWQYLPRRCYAPTLLLCGLRLAPAHVRRPVQLIIQPAADSKARTPVRLAGS